MDKKKSNHSTPQKSNGNKKAGNFPSKEEMEELRQEFIEIISRKCSRKGDFILSDTNPDSGYATKNFLIFRKDQDPWRVQKGHLIDWSDERFLKIQQMKPTESSILKKASEGSNFFEKILLGGLQVIEDQKLREVKKMIAKSFDIQWRNIERIGD